MCIKSVIPSNHLILCHPLLLPPSIFPSIRPFSNESVLHIRWPQYWSFSFSLSPPNEYSGLISFRMDWLDLLAVEGTLKSLLQQHHIFGGSKNLEIKMLAPWQKSYDQPRQHIKKQRCYFANEGPSSQSYGFPVVMYGRESWTTKIAERQRIDAFDHYLHPCFLPGMQERSLRTVQGQATSLRAQVPGCYWALSRGHVAGPYSASI